MDIANGPLRLVSLERPVAGAGQVLVRIEITAWEGLVDRARVSAGDKVLIHGGAGGVGHVAVQLARAFDAEVYATGSAGQRSIIECYGATFIDYREDSVEDYVAEFTAGRGSTLSMTRSAARRWTPLSKPHGSTVGMCSAVSVGDSTVLRRCRFVGRRIRECSPWPLLTGRGCEHHGEILRQAAALIESGRLRPLVDPHRFTLETAGEAPELLATKAAQGRVVVEI